MSFQESWPAHNLVSVAVTPVPVAKLRRASVGDVGLSIFDKKYERTITKNPLYFPGESVFMNDDLDYNVPVRNF